MKGEIILSTGEMPGVGWMMQLVLTTGMYPTEEMARADGSRMVGVLTESIKAVGEGYEQKEWHIGVIGDSDAN